jgi:hypothetical protein
MTFPLPTEWTPLPTGRSPRCLPIFAERRARSAPEMVDLSDDEVRAIAGQMLLGLCDAIRAEADAARATDAASCDEPGS